MPTPITQQLEHALTRAFQPIHLEIRNDSHKHASHREAPNTGDSHFHITLVSQKFESMSRVHRHRLVYESIADLIEGPIHALAIQTMTPDEWQQKAR